MAFGDPDISRKELLHRFRRITKHFPQSRHAERAGHGADILSRMVKEDEVHAAVKQRPLEGDGNPPAGGGIDLSAARPKRQPMESAWVNATSLQIRATADSFLRCLGTQE